MKQEVLQIGEYKWHWPISSHVAIANLEQKKRPQYTKMQFQLSTRPQPTPTHGCG